MPAGLVFPPRIWRSPVARAAAGALIALAAGTLRHWVFPMTGPRAPFAFFYPAVVMAAVAAGVPAGIAALLVSLGVALALPPYWPLHQAAGSDWLIMALFAVLAAFLVFSVSAIRRSRHAAQEAAEARALLAAIVDSSDDAIVSKDLNGRITSWNAAAERLFGYSADEIVGRSIETLLPQERADDFFEILSRIRRGERVEHYETLRKRKDGSTVELSLTVSPIVDASGQIVGASKIARDLTARREAEREQQRTRELLLGMLGHDLRNPLNTIAASLFYLEKRVPESLRHVVDRMTNSSNRMVRLIEQLLDVTRARLGGGIRLEPRAADLRKISLSVIDELEAQHPNRIRLTPGGEISGKWDVDRLAQVMANLLGNALGHGSPTDPVDVALAQEDGMVRIDVTNRGEPIPPSMQEAIFEPFRRAGGGSSGSLPGLGLGLYITREIVQAHDGSIRVTSRADGTTFSVRLPTRLAEAGGETDVRSGS